VFHVALSQVVCCPLWPCVCVYPSFGDHSFSFLRNRHGECNSTIHGQYGVDVDDHVRVCVLGGFVQGASLSEYDLQSHGYSYERQRKCERRGYGGFGHRDDTGLRQDAAGKDAAVHGQHAGHLDGEMRNHQRVGSLYGKRDGGVQLHD